MPSRSPALFESASVSSQAGGLYRPGDSQWGRACSTMTVRMSSCKPLLARPAASEEDAALIAASMEGDADVVASLLASGAYPSCFSTTSYGVSPLVASATSGDQGATTSTCLEACHRQHACRGLQIPFSRKHTHTLAHSACKGVCVLPLLGLA